MTRTCNGISGDPPTPRHEVNVAPGNSRIDVPYSINPIKLLTPDPTGRVPPSLKFYDMSR